MHLRLSGLFIGIQEYYFEHRLICIKRMLNSIVMYRSILLVSQYMPKAILYNPMLMLENMNKTVWQAQSKICFVVSGV
jgi:hypothetical protein